MNGLNESLRACQTNPSESNLDVLDGLLKSGHGLRITYKPEQMKYLDKRNSDRNSIRNYSGISKTKSVFWLCYCTGMFLEYRMMVDIQAIKDIK
jgi:hypothetical protein